MELSIGVVNAIVGATVLIVIVIELDAGDVFVAASVALAVIV